MQSMTGFCSALFTLPKKDTHAGTVEDIQLSLSIKTLNSRFFEVSCRLPSSLQFLETELIKYFKKEFHRGTVQCTIYMSSPSALTGTIVPALSTARSYVAALEQIKQECNLEGSVSLHDLVSLNNIFETVEAPLEQPLVDRLWTEIKHVTVRCNEERSNEGAALKADLQERIELIKQYGQKIKARAEIVMKAKKEQLLASLTAVLQEVGAEGTAEQHIAAIYNQLERLDVHEEIVRFATHISTIEELLDSPGVHKGKQLDFTLQELFRETNTIASKCSDAEMSGLAISVKVELEKAREQAQNIV